MIIELNENIISIYGATPRDASVNARAFYPLILDRWRSTSAPILNSAVDTERAYKLDITLAADAGKESNNG